MGHSQRLLIKLAPPDFSFKQLQIGDLPLYNQDDDANQAAQSPACSRTRLIMPPAPTVKMLGWGNLLGLLGASIGASGTAVAQQHLRNVLAYLDVPTLGQPEAFIHVREGFFSEARDIGNQETKGFPAGLDGTLCHVGEKARILTTRARPKARA